MPRRLDHTRRRHNLHCSSSSSVPALANATQSEESNSNHTAMAINHRFLMVNTQNLVVRCQIHDPTDCEMCWVNRFIKSAVILGCQVFFWCRNFINGDVCFCMIVVLFYCRTADISILCLAFCVSKNSI